jgi:hypothetical protein
LLAQLLQLLFFSQAVRPSPADDIKILFVIQLVIATVTVAATAVDCRWLANTFLAEKIGSRQRVKVACVRRRRQPLRAWLAGWVVKVNSIHPSFFR